MDKVFKLHSEKIIGFKPLTDADLGRSLSSHQTHIGLFDDVLTFLPNESNIESLAMFIYESNTEILDLNFNRIQNPNNTFRSPKIKTGGRDSVSVLSTIRNIARNSNSSLIWYLFWFGLESEQVVFWLFNNDSQAYQDIIKIGLNLQEYTRGGRLTVDDLRFNKVLSYIENTIDFSTQNILKELEIETQIPGKLITEKKIRKYDIQRAQSLFSAIGKMGEEFVAEYFNKLKFDNKIKNYTWVNLSSESGYPYDFWYQDNFDNVIYLDVKTTKFNFEQKVIYSDKEINYALSKPKNYYNIYRIYNLTDNDAKLRICENCVSYFDLINKNILDFQCTLGDIDTNVQSINIAFKPTIKDLNFGNEINLYR